MDDSEESELNSVLTTNINFEGTALLSRIMIHDQFWGKLVDMNATQAILYQWQQLERVGTIDNFRLVAKIKTGIRKGFFYTDSDAHKWAEAAALVIYNSNLPEEIQKSRELKELRKVLKNYIHILDRAQTPDGYLYTYNQLHFPDTRWKNLQIEHELYCMGHMIEAAVTYTILSKQPKNLFLDLAVKAANLIVTDFLGKSSPLLTPGHQEIEIALFRLFSITDNRDYLQMAMQFLNQRGKSHWFGFNMLSQILSQYRRSISVNKQRKQYLTSHSQSKDQGFSISETTHSKDPRRLLLRLITESWNGKYSQQHRPWTRIQTPVGHAVRWGYYLTALTIQHHFTRNPKLWDKVKTGWNRMVQRKMYITGGIGSFPYTEGFGKDYELSMDYAYMETCAAISSIFWSWQMFLAKQDASYTDLIEWQLYNAVNVGIGWKGTSYLYRNVLKANRDLDRQAWFATPCCPSNISRVWGRLAKYIYYTTSNCLYINQYIGNQAQLSIPCNTTLTGQNSSDSQDAQDSPDSPVLESTHLKMKMQSQLPWAGKILLQFTLSAPSRFSIKLRIPHWTDQFSIDINGKNYPIDIGTFFQYRQEIPDTTGLNPYLAKYYSIPEQIWNTENTIEINFHLPITIHHSHPKVKNRAGKIALSRGPLLYCLESPDNPDILVNQVKINPSSLLKSKYKEMPWGKAIIIESKSSAGEPLRFIPYYAWANRGASEMRVWLDSRKP